jgi:dihydroorotate dehydrogenase
MYKLLIRPLFFCFEPEQIHNISFGLIKTICKIPFASTIINFMYRSSNKKLKVRIHDLEFENPIGLAAGFDKDAKLFDELSCFGFGFVEVGTVTPKPQDGNSKPRLFRLIKDKGIVNRMGFNNGGVEAMVKRLKKRKTKVIIGGNIGKNKVTPNENAIKDYKICFEALYEHVDYFVVNVSSPNTPGLRSLQEKGPLLEILNRIMELNKAKPKLKAIFLKIAPDLEWPQIDEVIEVVQKSGIHGLIATNTTIDRSELKTATDIVEGIGNGGLSGGPLTNRATEVIRYISKKTGGKMPIIGVGGIMTAQDALDKLNAGASLVQVYSGFIYEGPALVKRANELITKRL